MADSPGEFEWFDPAILAAGFINRVVNAAAEGEQEYLRPQLLRHLFVIHELDGHAMRDHHGFRRTLAVVFGVRESSLGYGREAIPDFVEIFKAAPARRAALFLNSADRLLTADVQRFLSLVGGVESAARELETAEPPTQLLFFAFGPEPSFPVIDPESRQRAESHPGLRLTRGDIVVAPWNSVRDFDLGPQHQWTLSHAHWYYCSAGRRSAGESMPWHCIEENDSILFVRAADGSPCIEGVFARLPQGMRLVGLRYEADDARRGISFVGEDPFTAFRRLCRLAGIA